MSKYFSILIGILLCITLWSGCKSRDTNETTISPKKDLSKAQLIFPENGVYTGAYVDFGEGEDNVTYDALVSFEKMTGKHSAIIALGGFWGEQAFPRKEVDIVHAYGAVPLIFWSPWDKPYVESRGPDKFSLNEILAGTWDSYIDSWADGAKAFAKPVLVAWGLEMNGTWFPWSGCYYDGGELVQDENGKKEYKGSELYKKAFRYVVDRVRARKVDNSLWGFLVNNFSSPRTEWNMIAQYYPGAEYVDWLGMSVYGKMIKSEGWPEFNQVMEKPYQDICMLDAKKPILLAEWGVGEYPPEDKAGFIASALHDIQKKYTRIKGAVYWHERWENNDGSYSNLRINSSPESLDAYKKGIAEPYWVGEPQYRAKKTDQR